MSIAAEVVDVFMLVLLRPPNLPPRWLATTEPTPPSRFLQCFQRSFWALFLKTAPHIAASFDPCMNAWRVGDTARPPQHVCFSTASPLVNAGTAWTVWALYLVRPSQWSHLLHSYRRRRRMQWAISSFQEASRSATSICFQLTTLTNFWFSPPPP